MNERASHAKTYWSSPPDFLLKSPQEVLHSRINKACEMALQEMGIYADAEFKDLPDQLIIFRNIIDVLQGKGE
jgi:hypothetical protein